MAADRYPASNPGTASPLSSIDTIEQQLIEIWLKLLNLPTIGTTDNLLAAGANESTSESFVQQVHQLYGHNFPLNAVFEYPTIRQLAALIADGTAVDGESTLVAIQPHGSLPPLFLVHSVGGSPFWGYAEIARHLNPNQRVYGFRHTPRQKLEDCSQISKMASHYVDELIAFDPVGPYAIGGYCFGGNIAFEMAQIMEQRGRPVRLLVLFNSSAPNSSYDHMNWTFRSARLFVCNLGLWLSLFLSWDPELKRQYLRWKSRNFLTKIRTLLGVVYKSAETCDDLIDLTLFPEDKRALVKAHVQAQLGYHPVPYLGSLTLIRTSTHDMFCSFDSNYGWRELAMGGVTVHSVPGTHESMMLEPCVRSLAKVLQACLDKTN